MAYSPHVGISLCYKCFRRSSASQRRTVVGNCMQHKFFNGATWDDLSWLCIRCALWRPQTPWNEAQLSSRLPSVLAIFLAVGYMQVLYAVSSSHPSAASRIEDGTWWSRKVLDNFAKEERMDCWYVTIGIIQCLTLLLMAPCWNLSRQLEKAMYRGLLTYLPS